MSRSFFASAALGLCVALSIAASAQQSRAVRYAVDATWPKPLPNQWVLGGLGGLCVDAQGHVFILNRQDVLEGELNSGRLAPPIIEFDRDGNVVNSWGDPTLLDPRLHSCHVDKDNNIWIASAPSGMVQKYTHDGSKLLLQQIGKKGVVDSSDGTVKGKPLNSSAADLLHAVEHLCRSAERRRVRVGRRGRGRQSPNRGLRREGHIPAAMAARRHGNRALHDDRQGSGSSTSATASDREFRCYDTTGTFKRTIEVPWTPVTLADRRRNRS